MPQIVLPPSFNARATALKLAGKDNQNFCPSTHNYKERERNTMMGGVRSLFSSHMHFHYTTDFKVVIH